jgi:predicted DNA-binding transcriptional regulator AlpA
VGRVPGARRFTKQTHFGHKAHSWLSDSARSAASTVLLPPEPLGQLLELVVEQLAPRVASELASVLPQVEPASEPRRLLDVNEVAARLGRWTRWVRERAKRGQFPFVRLDGGALAFELEDVQAFARARRVSAGEAPVLASRLQDIRKPGLSPRSARRERATDPRVGA